MGERMVYEIRNDIDSSLAACVTLPVFAIQTLVENSVLHGLHDLEQFGKIVVDVGVDGDSLRVAVSDNGIGMPEGEIAVVSAAANENNEGADRGIGLRNVNRRLVLMGAQGLKIESSSGSGTIVSFKLPLNVDFAGLK